MNAILEPIINIDPVLNVRHIVEGMFRMFFPNPSARQFFCLRGISEKIDSSLGWYLWFDDKPGAYLLELIDASALDYWPFDSGDAIFCENVSMGRFQIKYFPDPDEKIFEHFSFYEQSVRLSDLFDDTGTPIIEADDTLHDSLFCVGNLDIVVENEGNFLEVCLYSPDSWLTISKEGLEINSGENPGVQSLLPSETDRSIPAWELSWFILDRLILKFLNGLFGFSNRFQDSSGYSKAAAMFSNTRIVLILSRNKYDAPGIL